MKTSVKIAERIESLPADEKRIMLTLLSRMERGRKTYGPWRLNDGRNFPREALHEVLDALHYSAAELARLTRGVNLNHDGRRRVYVCHPYSDDPRGNTGRIQAICVALLENGLLPIAPQLYLPQLIDEKTHRQRAIEMCLSLLDTCDELRVFGNHVSKGMRIELEHADERGIPICYAERIEG